MQCTKYRKQSGHRDTEGGREGIKRMTMMIMMMTVVAYSGLVVFVLHFFFIISCSVFAKNS